jgi:uncharacterized membrane protein
MSRIGRIFVTTLILGWLAGAAPATATTYTAIDYPGATSTIAYGINNTGKIVGNYSYGGGPPPSIPVARGFVKTGTVFSSFDFPTGSSSFAFAYGINDAGAIVGRYSDSSYKNHGFLLTIAGYSIIDYPGATSTEADGINDAGAIVGRYLDSSGAHGFVKTGSVYSSFEFPIGLYFPTGINDDGEIVGYYYDSSYKIHGFLLTSAGYSTIDYPSAYVTQANGINDAGEIVGFYVLSGSMSITHGFLLTSEGYSTIDYLGATSTIAYGINDAGAIVGRYLDSSGAHGFLITTTAPVPASMLLLGSGLLALVGRAEAREKLSSREI